MARENSRNLRFRISSSLAEFHEERTFNFIKKCLILRSQISQNCLRYILNQPQLNCTKRGSCYWSMPNITVCRYQFVCTGGGRLWPVSRLTSYVSLSRKTCHSCHIPTIPPCPAQLFCPGCSVPVALSWLSCPYCNVLAILSCLSCPGWLDLAHLYRLPCPGCIFRAVLSCHLFPVTCCPTTIAVPCRLLQLSWPNALS